MRVNEPQRTLPDAAVVPFPNDSNDHLDLAEDDNDNIIAGVNDDHPKDSMADEKAGQDVVGKSTAE